MKSVTLNLSFEDHYGLEVQCNSDGTFCATIAGGPHRGLHVVAGHWITGWRHRWVVSGTFDRAVPLVDAAFTALKEDTT